MRPIIRSLLLSLCLLGIPSIALSQPPVQIPEDATIGLVLSGGGARGLAHVGVIRVLESQGIRPTIITGTSMGSIIGALYASGRSVEEIDRIARTMNWQRALSDSSPRRDQPYPFRQLESGMNTDLRMSINSEGIAFPKGAIEGQHLEQTLAELFNRQGKPLQFEQLPKQFAAVAADLETGLAVPMMTGDLASAVRASMSIPGAIAPVEREGKLLVDGGIANNMPIDIARQMGADFIIAVDVSAPLKKREELDSLFSIAQQVTGILVNLNTSAQIKNLRDDEILITPIMDDYSSTSFDQAVPIIEAGLQACLTTFAIQKDSLPGMETDIVEADDDLPVIDFIRVRNTSVVGDVLVRSQISQGLGQPFDRELIEHDLSRLYGLDYFSVVRYRVVEEEGQTGLIVDSEGRETGNSWLKLGLELADDFDGNSEVGIAASLRSAGLNQYGGTAFARVELGTSPEIELRFLQPLTPRLDYFIEPSIGYMVDPLDFYDENIQDEVLSEYRRDIFWSNLAVGRLIWDGAGEFRVGIAHEQGDLDFKGGLDLEALGVDTSDFEDGYLFAQLGWDTLDDLGFPSSGQRWRLKAEQHRKDFSAEDDFSRVEADASFAYSWGRHTLLLEGDAEVSDSDEAGFVDIPFIGGFLELSGLPPRSRFGRHRVLVRSVYYRQLTENGPLPINIPMYMGFSLERGNVWLEKDNISWDNAIGAGSIFLGARTPLGPAYLSYGLTEEGDKTLAIFLGQRFR